ncbi:MAG: helix-turn-helix domain-containing protein [Paenibacillaceae bacterium]|nr:helix-turn-helix domain-containing protein [Paenibacillaceae bacterium]
MRSGPRFMGKITFTRKLMVYSMLLGIVPLLLLGLLSSYMAARNVQQEVNDNHRIILKQIEYQVDAFMKGLEVISVQLANDLAIEKALRYGISMQNLEPSLEMVETINKYRSYSSIAFNVSVINPSYDQAYSNQFGLHALKEYPFYEMIRGSVDTSQLKTIQIPPHTYPNQPELLLIRTIHMNALPSNGMLIMHIDAKQLNELFQSVNLGYKRTMLVIDDQGRIVLSGNQEEIGTRLSSSSDLYRYWKNGGTAASTFTLDRAEYQLSSQKSAFNNWTYISMTPTGELTRKSDHIRRITWYFAGALIVIWLMIAFFGSRRLTIPLRRITQKVTQDIRATRNEFQALDDYMDRMVEINRDLNVRLNEQQPHIKDSIILQLLRGELGDEQGVAKIRQYGLKLTGQWFHVCIVEVDPSGPFMQGSAEPDKVSFMTAFARHTAEICEPHYACATTWIQPGQLAVIVETEETNDVVEDKLLHVCAEIRDKLNALFAVPATIAMSRIYRGYGNMGEAYQEALRLMQYRGMVDNRKTITHKEIMHVAHSRQSSRIFVKWQNTIVDRIAEGEWHAAAREIGAMIDAMPEYVPNTASSMGIFTFLLGGIDHMLQERGYELQDCVAGDIYPALYAFQSLQEVREWLVGTVLPGIRRHMAATSELDNKKQVRQMIAYIHDHIEEDLALHHLEQEFHLSAAQIRRLFKEELQTNFMSYVIDCRMAKAKEWLIHTDISVKEIADRLSYTTPQNFSRIFKQMTGISPGKYRERLFQSGAEELSPDNG